MTTVFQTWNPGRWNWIGCHHCRTMPGRITQWHSNPRIYWTRGCRTAACRSRLRRSKRNWSELSDSGRVIGECWGPIGPWPSLRVLGHTWPLLGLRQLAKKGAQREAENKEARPILGAILGCSSCKFILSRLTIILGQSNTSWSITL